MKKVKVFNSSKNQQILAEAELADSFFYRFRGLLGKKNMQEECGLILRPCNSVHTIGMHFPIDVIFVDRKNRICHIIKNMQKGRISPIIGESKMVIEMAAGRAETLNLELGDVFSLC